MVVFVDVAVVFINDGDDDDVAVATLFEISVIIVVVITDGIRNNNDISHREEEKIQHRTRIGCCRKSLD